MKRRTLYGAFFLALVLCSAVAMINDDDDDDNDDDETSCVTSNGVKIEAGEKFISPCVFCSCIPGEKEAVCGGIDCPPLDCTNPSRVEGKCCPVCQ